MNRPETCRSRCLEFRYEILGYFKDNARRERGEISRSVLDRPDLREAYRKGLPDCRFEDDFQLDFRNVVSFRVKATDDGYNESDKLSFVATTTKETLIMPIFTESASAAASLTVTIDLVDNATDYVLHYGTDRDFLD